MRVFRAAAAGCQPLVVALEAAGIATPWVATQHGLNALDFAALGSTDDHADVVTHLLSTRAGRPDVLRKRVKNEPHLATPLHRAAAGGHPRTVAALSPFAEWWGVRDMQGLTAFAVACAHGNLACVKLMAANEHCLPDNPAPANNGDTPMIQVRRQRARPIPPHAHVRT